MAKNFDEFPHNHHRALQVWQILIAYAASRRSLTYTQLAEYLGWGSVKPLSKPLGHVMYWCIANDLPALTVLVVNKNTGRPGAGLALDGDTDREREKVFKMEWFKLIPPSPEQLLAAWRTEGESIEVDDE